MPRRAIGLLLLALVLGYFAGNVWSDGPTEAPTHQGRVAGLQQQLENGLQARLPREFQFIARVVALVQQKKLPLPLVQSTFVWARRQVTGRKYPFPYFERALRIRAKRIGVEI